MEQFNLQSLITHFTETHREFDIGDNVAIHFQDKFLPIKIDGKKIAELKVFKASFCIYDIYNEKFTPYDYQLDVEMISIEEYSDSPNSIYINANGIVESEVYKNITTIELGNIAILYVKNSIVHHCKFNPKSSL